MTEISHPPSPPKSDSGPDWKIPALMVAFCVFITTASLFVAISQKERGDRYLRLLGDEQEARDADHQRNMNRFAAEIAAIKAQHQAELEEIIKFWPAVDPGIDLAVENERINEARLEDPEEVRRMTDQTEALPADVLDADLNGRVQDPDKRPLKQFKAKKPPVRRGRRAPDSEIFKPF